MLGGPSLSKAQPCLSPNHLLSPLRFRLRLAPVLLTLLPPALPPAGHRNTSCIKPSEPCVIMCRLLLFTPPLRGLGEENTVTSTSINAACRTPPTAAAAAAAVTETPIESSTLLADLQMRCRIGRGARAHYIR